MTPVKLVIGNVRVEYNVSEKTYNFYLYDNFFISNKAIDSNNEMEHFVTMATDLLELDKLYAKSGGLLNISEENVKQTVKMKDEFIKKMTNPQVLETMEQIFGPGMGKTLKQQLEPLMSKGKEDFISSDEEINKIIAELQEKNNHPKNKSDDVS